MVRALLGWRHPRPAAPGAKRRHAMRVGVDCLTFLVSFGTDGALHQTRRELNCTLSG